jgi:hypothetical protein
VLQPFLFVGANVLGRSADQRPGGASPGADVSIWVSENVLKLTYVKTGRGFLYIAGKRAC